MKDTTNKSQAADQPHRIAQLWRVFPKKREGLCCFCGEPTTETNMFNKDFFRHERCRDMNRERERSEREKREKIELMKSAPREIESERPKKQEDDALFGAGAEKRRADQLGTNCTWLIDKIDRIHMALCPGQSGTWQQRAEQAVRAAELAAQDAHVKSPSQT